MDQEEKVEERRCGAAGVEGSGLLTAELFSAGIY